MSLHSVAFTRDETFASCHHFVITRASENQVYFASVSRAGEAWGDSIVCPPWLDIDHEPHRLGYEEAFRSVTIDREFMTKVRKRIPLRADRLRNYRDLNESR